MIKYEEMFYLLEHAPLFTEKLLNVVTLAAVIHNGSASKNIYGGISTVLEGIRKQK